MDVSDEIKNSLNLLEEIFELNILDFTRVSKHIDSKNSSSSSDSSSHKNTGSANTNSANTNSANTGSANTNSANTNSANTDSHTNTNSANTGTHTSSTNTEKISSTDDDVSVCNISISHKNIPETFFESNQFNFIQPEVQNLYDTYDTYDNLASDDTKPEETNIKSDFHTIINI